MKDDFGGWIRVAAFIVLVIYVIVLCSMKTKDSDERDPLPQTEIASKSIQEPERAPEPEADPEPEPEPEPNPVIEIWESLGPFELTAYCSCEICCGYWATIRPIDENGNPIIYTSTGEIAQAGTTIAVDPTVIPYGSTVRINNHDYIAQDTGGAIVGNHIDIYFDDHQEALEFGRQSADVFVKIEPR